MELVALTRFSEEQRRRKDDEVKVKEAKADGRLKESILGWDEEGAEGVQKDKKKVYVTKTKEQKFKEDKCEWKM